MKKETLKEELKLWQKKHLIDEKKKKALIEKRFGGIKSKITSNGILKGDAGRLFYMGGFLAYPEENDNRGGYIYEFDYGVIYLICRVIQNK